MVKIKRFISILIGLFMALSAFAYDFKVDGICYNKISDTEVEVTYAVAEGYTLLGDDDYCIHDYNENCSSSVCFYYLPDELVIPSSVIYGGSVFNVVRLGTYCFKNCGFSSVVIPNSITEIGKSAFEDCSSLVSIVIHKRSIFKGKIL